MDKIDHGPQTIAPGVFNVHIGVQTFYATLGATQHGGQMRALQVHFDKDKDEITRIDDQEEEEWLKVCERFDNDVHRICDSEGQGGYTALYSCFDEDNIPSYYLVEEDRQLEKIRRKVFFNKLGR
ncbi:MAG: hypothetical protein PVJ19_09340 [Desulfobacteraceae bacterium]|jgi:hypothetical protein